MDFSEKIELAQKYASLLEKNSFEAAEKILLEWADVDIERAVAFKDLFDLYIIYSQICSHKISLATFLAKSAGVAITEDDYTRIIFALAANAQYDLAEINNRLNAEFGPNFRLLPQYTIENAVRTWKELALRAKEIKNGLWNHACFTVLVQARAALDLYKAKLLTDDMEKAIELIKLADEILIETRLDPSTAPISKDMSATNDKIRRFYKETNHLAANEEEIFSSISYDEILVDIFNSRLVLDTKVFLSGKAIPLDDFKAARRYIMRKLAEAVFDDTISVEELARSKKPLEKITPKPQQAEIAKK